MTATLNPPAAPEADDDAPLTVEELAELSDRDLGDYIAENLTADDAWPALLSPDMAKRTRGRLNTLKSAAIQQAQHNASAMAKLVYDEWWQHRGRAALDAINRRRNMAERAAQREHVVRTEAKARETMQLVRRLAVGIQRHRLACIGAGLNPEVHDRELWKLLELRFGGDEPGTSLNEVLGTGAWDDVP